LQFSTESETVRYATSTINKNLTGVASGPMKHTQNAGPGKSEGVISENVSRLMNDTYFDSYATFASTRYTNDLRAEEWLSLEALHNSIHVCDSYSSHSVVDIGSGVGWRLHGWSSILGL
jgi:hypothetical protein